MQSFSPKLLRASSNGFILIGMLLLILSFGPLIKDEVWYLFKSLKSQEYVLSGDSTSTSAFSRFLTSAPVSIVPINMDFSIVIEKIGVNAPIVADVSVSDTNSYLKALESGVAHALTSPYPSQDAGNVYLFAHASTDFWRLGRYATVFNLLRKLEVGDKIHVFYQGNTFIYTVVNKEILDGWNTYPLTRPVLEPTLTLQTCSPPGTTLNRLVVTATLLEMK